MKFFVFAAKDSAEAESVYKGIKKFVSEQSPYELIDRRIFSIDFKHDGVLYHSEVGKDDPRVKEPVVAILESTGLFYVCTPNRGVARGEPVFVGTNEIIKIIDFES